MSIYFSLFKDYLILLLISITLFYSMILLSRKILKNNNKVQNLFPPLNDIEKWLYSWLKNIFIVIFIAYITETYNSIQLTYILIMSIYINLFKDFLLLLLISITLFHSMILLSHKILKNDNKVQKSFPSLNDIEKWLYSWAMNIFIAISIAYITETYNSTSVLLHIIWVIWTGVIAFFNEYIVENALWWENSIIWIIFSNPISIVIGQIIVMTIMPYIWALFMGVFIQIIRSVIMILFFPNYSLVWEKYSKYWYLAPILWCVMVYQSWNPITSLHIIHLICGILSVKLTNPFNFSKKIKDKRYIGLVLLITEVVLFKVYTSSMISTFLYLNCFIWILMFIIYFWIRFRFDLTMIVYIVLYIGLSVIRKKIKYISWVVIITAVVIWLHVWLYIWRLKYIWLYIWRLKYIWLHIWLYIWWLEYLLRWYC